MIQNGANPHLRNFDGQTEYEMHQLSGSISSSISQSVYFQTAEFKNKQFLSPMMYKAGVFPGNFKEVIGKGGEGTVIIGNWNGVESAFKFVRIYEQNEIDNQKEYYLSEIMANINKRLRTVKNDLLYFFGKEIY